MSSITRDNALDTERYTAIARDTVTEAMAAGATAAEAWVTTGQVATVRVRAGAVDERTRGLTNTLGLRVIVGDRAGTMTTTDLEPGNRREIARLAVSLATWIAPDPLARLPERTGQLPAPLALVDPAVQHIMADDLRELARRCEDGMLQHDRRVRAGDGASAAVTSGVTALANSDGFAGSYAGAVVSCWADAIAEADDGKLYTDWWVSSSRRHADLEAPEAIGAMAARRAIDQIGARPVPTRTVPVIWSPVAAIQALLPPVVMAMSGERANRGQSFLIGQEGAPVASPLVTLVDDATPPGGLLSRPFDAEGVPSQRTALLTDGVFAHFLYDSYHARKAGRESTGNATRDGAAISVGASNLTLMAGTSDPTAMIGEVEQGLYLTSTIGFGVNPATGDYSRGASGFWIERGEPTYPVSEVNIAGRLPEMLASIDAVGNDPLTFEGSTAPTLRMQGVVVSGR